MTLEPQIGLDDYDIRVATAADIWDLIVLQAENQIGRGGALSIEFPADWYEIAINDLPIIVARREGRLVAYLVSSSRAATANMPLVKAKFQAYPARPDAYNSGPLCIAASERGRGLAAKLFQRQRTLLRGREGVAFIRRDNAVSRAAHAKYGFREVAAFTHAAVEYMVVSNNSGPSPAG